MKEIVFVFIVIFSLLVTSCATSGSFAKKAAKLEQAGLYEEASQFYLYSLQRNYSNVDAKIGLKKTGQMVLDDKLATFFKSYAVQDYKNAVYTYLKAMEYKNDVGRFVQLSVPGNYEKDFEESKSIYLRNRYEEANELLEQEKFKQAEEIFGEIQKIEPNYENVSNLKNYSKAQPLYNQGIELYKTKKYREALKAFDEVIQLQGNFKKVMDYRQKTLDDGTITVAFLPFESTVKGGKQVADRVYAGILDEVLKAKDPFLKVIDRQNMEKIMQEQKLSLTGLVDEKNAARAGMLMGAQLIVTGNLLSYEVQEGQMRTVEKKGYEEFFEKSIDPITKQETTVARYRKVTYQEVGGSSSVAMSFQMNLINVETGEIKLAEKFSPIEKDEVAYLNYKGNPNNLLPGDWSNKVIPLPSDKMYKSGPERQRLQQLSRQRQRNLLSAEELRTNAISKIGRDCGRRIAFINL
jgi:tetratricopeptide (TPR) repeat protein